MLGLPDDDAAKSRGRLVGVTTRLQDVNGGRDGAERVAQLVAQHCHELVLGPARRLHALEVQPENLIVLTAQALADLQEDLEADLGIRLGEAAQSLSLDL